MPSIQTHDRWSIYQEFSAQLGDGYVRWVEDAETAYVVDIQAGASTRGRMILNWLASNSGRRLHAVGVVEDAQDFWDKMEEEGLVEGQSHEDFMTFFCRGSGSLRQSVR